MIKYSFVQRRNNTVTCATPPLPPPPPSPLTPIEGNTIEEIPGAASKPMALHLVILFALLFMLTM